MRRPCLPVACCLVALSSLAGAQEEPAPEFFEEKKDVSVRLSGELKAHYRWSEDDRFPLRTPFPPEFVPVGQENVALQTVAPGSSLEVSKATLSVDVSLPRQVSARVKLDFIDLYDRNPTSTDKKVDVDEVWVALGRRQESLLPIEGTSLYALFGKAPKFERQPLRRLESYGLVSTAFNRFPDLQLQVGGSIGLRVLLLRPGLERQPDLPARPERPRRRQRDGHAAAAQPRPCPPQRVPDLLPRGGRGPGGRRPLRDSAAEAGCDS